MRVLRRLMAENRGVTALEYALIALLVAIVLIGGAATLGTNLGGYYSSMAQKASLAF